MRLETALEEREGALGFAVFEIEVAQHLDGGAVAGMGGERFLISS